MRSKTLGRTGLEVSIVGLGTAFTGMPTIDPAANTYEKLAATVDIDLGIETVVAGMQAGCTLIDTAALYGGGRSEIIIGHACRQHPDLAARCTITTKVGRTVEGLDYSYDAILRSIEISRERLSIDQFAVVYIHDPMGVPMSEVMGDDRALGALRHLQDQGIIRYVGIAADEPATNTRYIETGEFDAAVVPRAWSLLNLLAQDRILPAAIKYSMGIVIATPLERGLLATGPIEGAYYFDRNYSAECQAHVGKIQELCRQHNLPLLAVSLQWCVRHPQIAATIPGARLPEEAKANAAAAEVDIPDSFWSELDPLIQHWEEGIHR